jgi:hypothetical protein
VSADQFLGIDSYTTGKIDRDYTHLTVELLQESESGIELQVTCHRDQAAVLARSRAPKFVDHGISCTISIIIYGPLEMCNEVGEYFQLNQIYLQDPRDCDRNVRYCNPHRLSSADLHSCLWTSELHTETGQLIEVTAIAPQPTLLDAIDSHEDLPETVQPGILKTELQRYVSAHSSL